MVKVDVTQRNLFDLPVGRYPISDGLSFVVTGKYRGFVFRKMVKGKTIQKRLGSAKKVTLAKAKYDADKLRLALANGENPLEKKSIPTLKECAQAVIDVQEKTKRWRNDRSRKAWENSLSMHVFPLLGEKTVDTITLDDVYEVLQPLWFDKTETASRIRGRLEKIFDFASFRGYITSANPARWRGGLENLFPSPSKVKNIEHHEALTLEEAQLCARKFCDSKYVSHKAVLFGMLTCARLSEFLLAKWDEVDLKNAVWVCPAGRAKTGVTYRFPLSTQAVVLLNSIEQASDFVFVNNAGRTLALDTPRVILRKNVKRPVTMHGIRSTFRDWCAENGVDRVLAEKSLMHVVGSDVEQAYQRSDLLDQRREVMQRWADVLIN